MEYIILLQDQTVGHLVANEAPKAGSVVTVELHDENGNPATATGAVEAVLESSEY